MEPDFRGKKVGIIGLGLIGGSLAKAFKENTQAEVFGFDLDNKTLEAALKEKAIDEVLDIEKELQEMDITIVCLFVRSALSFILKHKNVFKKRSIVLDVCGIKQMIMTPIEAVKNKEFYFVGTHPMAGKEQVGYFHSEASLFTNSNMILVPLSDTPGEVLKELETLSYLLGFEKVVTTTPKHHDKVIAYTSQLCHVVSNAFVQSPTAKEFQGYSAGSFKDLTRVAKLNPVMWAELFLLNREALLQETQTLIDKLEEFKDLIDKSDRPGLKDLLEEGSNIKEELMKQE